MWHVIYSWIFFFFGIDVGIIGAQIGRLSLDGEIENDSDGTQTGILPTMNSGDIFAEEITAEKVFTKPKTI